MRCLAARVRGAGGAQIVRLERLESTWEKLSDAHRASRALALTLAVARARLEIRRGSLGDEAGLLGAAHQALQRLV